jgi:hypothetical protein
MTENIFMNAKWIPMLSMAMVCTAFPARTVPAQSIDLPKRYPTTLTEGDDTPDRARPWEFTDADIFRVSRFGLEVGNKLRIDVGEADLGIGHCADGAVWAVIVPRREGKLESDVTTNQESIAHIWLRFHPAELAHLFPAGTVFTDGTAALASQIRIIVSTKFTSSWHAGMNAMIPERKTLTVDVDTKGGPRRFFVVDTEAQKAEYVEAFANRFVKPPPKLTKALAEEAFDKLWQGFDRDYAMFVLRPEVDWAGLREKYRPQALAAKSAYEFAGVCAEMLKPLRDLHIWLKVAGADVPVFNRPRSSNSNPAAHRQILGGFNDAGLGLGWAVTDDKIGYLVIQSWNSSDLPLRCQEVLEEMRDTRGLIVDVRLNGGGSEDQAMEVAGRFVPREFVYAYSQFRGGPAHTNLTQKFPRTVTPKGPWRYDRPVVLLVGQKCMSSNESFIAMMSGDPDMVTMGDHTCGSSGNPRMLKLPLDITVSIPRWIDYLPDGSPLDERGFQPQIPFKPQPGAFEGTRDDLLTAALDRLRKLALPKKPIAGPAFGSTEAGGPENLRIPAQNLPDHSAEAKEEAQDASRPKVVSVWPTPEAKEVPLATELRIRFDRPMDPLSLKLQWESGGFLHCEFPKYDSTRFEFLIPVRLAPGVLHQIVVNAPFIKQPVSDARKQWPLDGFQSPDHRLAGLYAWRFSTQDWASSPEAPVPKAVTVTPSSGADVARLTFVNIQFDQAMSSPETAFPYVTSPTTAHEPAGMLPFLQYDSATRTFRLPLVLPPKTNPRFTLAGFRSTTGVRAEPIRVEYQVAEEEFSKTDGAKIEAGTKDKRLLDLLAVMKQKRAQLTSLAERVQTLELRSDRGLLVGIESRSASFKWAKPACFYADASQEMLSCRVFTIGCDGQEWWWHTGKELVRCPMEQMDTVNASLSDPFYLGSQTPAEAATASKLVYAGQVNLGGGDTEVVESWSPEGVTRWYIDPRSHLPVQVEGYSTYDIARTRFLYDAINEPVAPESFAIPKVDEGSSKPLEPLGEGYTRRFVNIRDGSDGRMSVRWGKIGPQGRSSSGLN